MAESDGVFGADIPAVREGGQKFKHLSTLALTIFGDLHNTTSKYPDLGGNGDIGKAFTTNYYPAADASLKFLSGVKDLVDTHGGKTLNLGTLLGDVHTTTTTEAGPGHIKAH